MYDDNRSDSTGFSDLINKNVSPVDFCEFVPWACLQLEAEFTAVVIKIRTASIDRSSRSQESKITGDSSEKSHDDLGFAPNYKKRHSIIKIFATYDKDNTLTRIKFMKKADIPRILLKVIAMTFPFQPNLNSLVYGYANQVIIHEIKHQLSISNVTQVSLDASYVAQANYHILLDGPNSLSSLSLSKCLLTDSVVQTLAMKLTNYSSGGKTLSVLNLSSNRITDVGAKYLAEALRSNRKLNYLNLADNLITDNGANDLFHVLKRFPIREKELSGLLQRHNKYQENQKQLASILFYDHPSGNSDIKAKKKKKKSDKDITSVLEMNSEEKISKMKLQTLAQRIPEKFQDPFATSEIITIDGVPCCRGNNALSYLNLAFNDLTYFSVRALFEVLTYQKELDRKPRGLINVRIDGNFLPEFCLEYRLIDNLFNDFLSELVITDRKVSRIKK